MAFEVTIYVFGDAPIARDVIQGMSAMYDALSITTTTNVNGEDAMNGANPLIWSVLLVLFGSILAWFYNQRYNFGHLAAAGFTWLVMLTPTGTVYIDDLMSTDLQVVPNARGGILVMAALSSAVTHDVTERYHTWYTPINAGEVSDNVYDSGFISPLRLMLSLRRIIPRTGNPYLYNNLTQYMRKCAVRSAGVGSNLDTASGKINWLLNHPRGEELVTFKTVTFPDGVVFTCTDAATSLSNELTTYLTTVDGEATSDINAAIAAPIGEDFSSSSEYEFTDIENYLTTIFNGNANLARGFLTDLIFYNWASASMTCGNAADNFEFKECVTLTTEALETSKVSEAATGSIFQKIMLPLMNILQYLFFGLSPIVVIAAVAMGLNGVSILFKYALFGLWTQSWMPTAIFINYLVSRQTSEQLQNFTASVGAGDYNPQHFYDIISTNVMIASNVLAATPMITLAILSGGMFALTSVAGNLTKASGTHVNPKNTSPEMRKTEPLHNFGGKTFNGSQDNIFGKKTFGDWAESSGEGLLGSFNVGKLTQSGRTAGHARMNTAARTAKGTWSKAGRQLYQAVNTHGFGVSGSNSHTVTGQESHQIQNAIKHAFGNDAKITDTQATQLTGALGISLSNLTNSIKGLTASAKNEKIRKAGKNLANIIRGIIPGIDANATSRIADELIKGATQSEGFDLNRMHSGNYQIADVGALLKTATQHNSASISDSAEEVEMATREYTDTVQEQERIESTASQIDSYSRAYGGDLYNMVVGKINRTGSAPLGYSEDDFRQKISEFKNKGWLDDEQAEQAMSLYSAKRANIENILKSNGIDSMMSPHAFQAVTDFYTQASFVQDDTSLGNASADQQLAIDTEKMVADFTSLPISSSTTADVQETMNSTSVRGLPDGSREQQLAETGQPASFGENKRKAAKQMNDLPTPRDVQQVGNENAGYTAGSAYDSVNREWNDPKSPYRQYFDNKKALFEQTFGDSATANMVRKAQAATEWISDHKTQLSIMGRSMLEGTEQSVSNAYNGLASDFYQSQYQNHQNRIAQLDKSIADLESVNSPSLSGQLQVLKNARADLAARAENAQHNYQEAQAGYKNRTQAEELLHDVFRSEAESLGLEGAEVDAYANTRNAVFYGETPTKPTPKDPNNLTQQDKEAMFGYIMGMQASKTRKSPGLNRSEMDGILNTMMHKQSTNRNSDGSAARFNAWRPPNPASISH